MLLRWFKWLRRNRLPAAYRPGVTLLRLRQDLSVDCQLIGQSTLACVMSDGLAFSVREHTESLFLSHIVSCEFCMPVPLMPDVIKTGRIVIRHTGNLRRLGTVCLVVGRDDGSLAAIARQLQHDKALQAALLPLDFRRCELRYEDEGWQFCIEHFGASEVVSRMPPLRRYIRLITEQRQVLLQSLRACHALFIK
ncbi:DUF3156 family protein [Iodobacter sp.]|uniref:DUF3156 family protein n=1 Tax=Iodobacter sp. TaxID=1915058 RepID=UPI0025DC91CE|nr:DUF3156 family protein [Iodobacter sp.]